MALRLDGRMDAGRATIGEALLRDLDASLGATTPALGMMAHFGAVVILQEVIAVSMIDLTYLISQEHELQVDRGPWV